MSEIPIRYVKQYAEGRDGGISLVETDWDEGKFCHGEARLEVNPGQCALALVDFWDTCWHEEPIAPEYGWVAEMNEGLTFQNRAKQITLENVVPLLQCARASGMTVVHLPCTEIAVKYPQCRRLQQLKLEEKKTSSHTDGGTGRRRTGSKNGRWSRSTAPARSSGGRCGMRCSRRP